MSNQAKVTSYYTRKRKARDDPEPAAKRKRVDTHQRTSLTNAVALEAPSILSTRTTKSKASETLDQLFGTPGAPDAAVSKSQDAATTCDLFAPKITYHGRAKRNVGSVLSLHSNSSRSKQAPKEADQEWCRPTAPEKAMDIMASSMDATPLSSASSKFAALAAPMSLSAKPRVRAAGVRSTVAEPVQTKVQQPTVALSSTDDDLLPSTRLQRLAEPIQIASSSSTATAALTAKLSSTLPLPIAFKRLQEKMEATDNLLCMRRQYGGSFTQVKEGVQRMTLKDYTMDDVARMTTILPPAYVLSQEKVEKDYELHIKLNCAWKEDLRLGRKASGAFKLPSGTKEVIQLKAERKETFRDRLTSHVNNAHQQFLGGLSINWDEEKPLTHWHPKFKLDSVPSIQCADLPKPPISKMYSSASEVLQLTTIKSEKVSRALQTVAEASAAKPSQATASSSARPSAASPSQNLTAVKSTLTPPPTPRPADDKTAKASSMKGIPSSLLEKIRKREAENALMAMTCPPERERELHMWDKLPELCRCLCSVFISERKDVLEVGTVIRGLKQSIPSLQGSTNAQVEELLILLLDNLKKFASLVSVASRSQRYVKLVANAKSQVSVLLEALAVQRKKFDNELRSSTLA